MPDFSYLEDLLGLTNDGNGRLRRHQEPLLAMCHASQSPRDLAGIGSKMPQTFQECTFITEQSALPLPVARNSYRGPVPVLFYPTPSITCRKHHLCSDVLLKEKSIQFYVHACRSQSR